MGWVGVRQGQSLTRANQGQDYDNSLLTQVTSEMGVASGDLSLSSLLQLFICLFIMCYRQTVLLLQNCPLDLSNVVMLAVALIQCLADRGYLISALGSLLK